jgi:hypothetical protein
MFNLVFSVRAAVLGLGLLTTACVSAQTATIACGGETQNEFTRIMEDKKNHSLLVLYVSRDASYLSDVETFIQDEIGEVVAQAPACGPLGQVDVSAAGLYRISARHRGKEQSHEALLEPKGGGRVIFMWE